MSTLKRCTKCGAEKRATLEIFPAEKHNRDGLHCWCRACHREKSRRYRATPEGREADRARQRRYRATPEGREANLRYLAAHAEKYRQYSRRWTRNNPEKTRAQACLRLARKRGLAAAKTPTERAAVRDVYDTAALASMLTGNDFHVDHRQAISLGGSSLAENLQHLPARMNLAKGDMSHEQALDRVAGYRAWTEQRNVFEQVTWRTFH
jgi:hypothetical protein